MLSKRGEFFASIIARVASFLCLINFDVVTTPTSKKLWSDHSISNVWSILNLCIIAPLALMICTMAYLISKPEYDTAEKLTALAFLIPTTLTLGGVLFMYVASDELLPYFNGIYILERRIGMIYMKIKLSKKKFT